MQYAGQPAEASLATLEDVGFGATRKTVGQRAKEVKIRGDSEIHRRQSRRVRESGKLDDLPIGTAGRCGTRGDPKPHRKRHWSSEDSGQPENSHPGQLKDARFEETRRSIAGTAERCRMRGNSNPHPMAVDGAVHGSSNLRLHHY